MEYLVGSPKTFYDFIGKISKKDKIGIVSHTDLDGIASAVFLQKILDSHNLKINFMNFLDHDSEVLKQIFKKDYDKLFFTDWNTDAYLKDFEKLRNKGEVFVIDHHPLNNKLKDHSNMIKTDSIYCSAQCLFDLAKKYFDTKSLEWLVCAAMITDYTWDKSEKNFQFIKNIYPEIKKDTTIWNSKPGKIGELITGALVYYHPNFKKVYNFVLNKDFEKLKKANETINKEITEWTEKFKEESDYFPEQNLRFYYGNPKHNIASIIASILSSKDFKNNTLIFVSDIPHKKGFVKISARNETGKINLNKVLKNSIYGFENSGAGGHINASGANFPKKYVGEFKKNLLKELSRD